MVRLTLNMKLRLEGRVVDLYLLLLCVLLYHKITAVGEQQQEKH